MKKTILTWVMNHFTFNLEAYIDAEDDQPKVVKFFGVRTMGWGFGFHYVSKKRVGSDTKARFDSDNNDEDEDQG